MTRLTAPLTAIALYLAGFFVFFRWQLLSGFDLVFGDRGDARLVAFLHEHAYNWLFGRAALLSPPFFYDQTQTLGYSEAFLLNQVVYAPVRLLGADPYMALSLVAMALSAVCFTFTYLLLRRLDVPRPLAAAGALIVTFPNNLFIKSGHPQHFAVYYLPVVAYCGLVALMQLHDRPRRSYVVGAAGAALLGMVFSTGYYMAWFFALGLLILVPVVLWTGREAVRVWIREGPRRVRRLTLSAAAGFLSTIAIFLAVYWPVLAQGGGRSFEEYLFFAPELRDLFNVGGDNLLWSGAVRALSLVREERLQFGEAVIALTPILQILVLTSGVLVFQRRLWPRRERGSLVRALVLGSVWVCVGFFVLTVKVGDASLFKFLLAAVPGATGIRVGYRGMVVANLFAAIAITVTFGRLVRLAAADPGRGRRFGTTAVVSILFPLLALEQVNVGRPTNLSRQYEREHMRAVSTPPGECRTFYAAAQPARAPYEVQLDAMLVAQTQGLPTINGYSGFQPEGWSLYDTTTPDYELRAQQWALERGLSDGLCRTDIASGSWNVVRVDPGALCAGPCARVDVDPDRDFLIDLRTGGNGTLFTDSRWSGPEPWGAWTGAVDAALLMSIESTNDLEFSITMRGLLSEEAPTQSVWLQANECHIGRVEYDLAKSTESRTVSGTIPQECIGEDGNIRFRIRTDRASRPQDIGINDDTRRLGVGVERVVIRESDSGSQAAAQ